MPEFMFLGGDDMPEELREHIERHRMESSEVTHSIHRLIEELNEDQIEALARLIRAVSNDESTGSFYIGIMAAQTKQRTGRCLACGRNHDEDAAALAGGAVSHEQPPLDGGNPHAPAEPLGARIEQAVLYHVEPVEDGNYEGAMRCVGVAGNGPCGIEYVSLEDRMLRRPSECSGCQQKAKFG